MPIEILIKDGKFIRRNVAESIIVAPEAIFAEIGKNTLVSDPLDLPLTLTYANGQNHPTRVNRFLQFTAGINNDPTEYWVVGIPYVDVSGYYAPAAAGRETEVQNIVRNRDISTEEAPAFFAAKKDRLVPLWETHYKAFARYVELLIPVRRLFYIMAKDPENTCPTQYLLWNPGTSWRRFPGPNIFPDGHICAGDAYGRVCQDVVSSVALLKASLNYYLSARPNWDLWNVVDNNVFSLDGDGNMLKSAKDFFNAESDDVVSRTVTTAEVVGLNFLSALTKVTKE